MQNSFLYFRICTMQLIEVVLRKLHITYTLLVQDKATHKTNLYIRI